MNFENITNIQKDLIKILDINKTIRKSSELISAIQKEINNETEITLLNGLSQTKNWKLYL